MKETCENRVFEKKLIIFSKQEWVWSKPKGWVCFFFVACFSFFFFFFKVGLNTGKRSYFLFTKCSVFRLIYWRKPLRIDKNPSYSCKQYHMRGSAGVLNFSMAVISQIVSIHFISCWLRLASSHRFVLSC